MDLARICHNRTPLSVRAAPMDDRRGREVLVVIAKLTLAVSAAGVVAIARRPREIRLSDVPASAEPSGSLRYPSDLIDEKPGTDVLLVGSAHPPPGRAVSSMTASVRVEAGQRTLSKTVTVHGPRVWYRGALGVVPGPPALLTAPVPLLYEHAYGGRDDTDPAQPLVEWRNPAGTGFARDRARLVGQAAPALEDPAAPLSSRSPAPAAFGPIAAHWLPRSKLAGTHDEAWARTRAPVRPVDFDPRHNACAHPDLHSDVPLPGDVSVEILGATPEGTWRFQLPAYEVEFRALVRGVLSTPETHLDTYLIDAEARVVELVWRARVPMPRKSEAIEAVYVTGKGDLPEGIGP